MILELLSRGTIRESWAETDFVRIQGREGEGFAGRTHEFDFESLLLAINEDDRPDGTPREPMSRQIGH